MAKAKTKKINRQKEYQQQRNNQITEFQLKAQRLRDKMQSREQEIKKSIIESLQSCEGDRPRENKEQFAQQSNSQLAADNFHDRRLTFGEMAGVQLQHLSEEYLKNLRRHVMPDWQTWITQELDSRH